MRLAYIDIGYNAVRSVVYEENKLGSIEIFSDKFKSDIVSLLELDNLDIRHQVYLSLQYLSHIFKQLNVDTIHCVATAVLRDNPNAKQFQEIIKNKFNINIQILSGEEEAYLTAMGLISGISNADGLVADLGGGSLELASVFNKQVGIIKSLALGTKIISKNNLDNISTIKDIISKAFPKQGFANLYFIGGALRFIGRFYMEFMNYPLKNLHNLEIPVFDFQIYLQKLDHLVKIKTLYEKKADSNAILVAKALVELFSPEKIIISNYGLKEGLRFTSLPKEEQQKDIILERIKHLLVIHENIDLEKYHELLGKLLINPDDITSDILNYVVMLLKLNRNIDKSLKINFAVDFVLSCDIPLSQRQRLMVAISLSFSYNDKMEHYVHKLAKKMLSKKDYYNSQIIGNFVRIALIIDGPYFNLPTFSMNLKDNYIEILTAEILPHQIFEKVCTRLKEIGYARKISKNK